MDKIDLLLDAIDHPEKYSSEQLSELASDPETAEVYTTLCKIKSSAFADDSLTAEETDRQWEIFKSRRRVSPFRKVSRRAAIWTAVVIASLSALAIGVTITMNSTSEQNSNIEETFATTPDESESQQSNQLPADTVADRTETDIVVFNGETLPSIIDRISHHYGLKPEYKSDASKDIILYYRWNPEMPAEEVVDDLNTFERIQVSLNENVITIY